MPPIETLLWLIPVLPLVGFLINGFLGHRLSAPAVAAVGTTGPALSFLIAVIALFQLQSGAAPFSQEVFSWIQTAGLSVAFGLQVDALTAVMLMVVTGVGSAIHLYSYGYMHDDPGIARFFAYLNLFMFAMLLLVMADNLLLLFVGWEGVGLCSYLLIGFWYTDLANADAGRKAFVANRVGDLAFLVGLFALFSLTGSLDFAVLEAELGHAHLDEVLATGPFAGWTLHGVLRFATGCLFVGATGKSAQIPLYTWLPDAMAGPTPVSALIHAATMVTAGVYLIARLDFIFAQLPVVMATIGLVAAATATLAAVIAVTENDIKKILAYSTISQLGYMFAGVASTVFVAGVFHLVTHAFFKALLFLGAGAVIHALHGEQDIRRMGGLRRDMPGVFGLFAVGALALAGLPPLAGFWSKDEILSGVYLQGSLNGGVWELTWWLLVATAGLTAFYTLRLLIVAFFGRPVDPHRHLHATHWTMTAALALLAALSLVGGALAAPLEHFTEATWAHGWAHAQPHEALHAAHNVAMGASLTVVTLGVLAAIVVYGFGREALDTFVRGPAEGVHWLISNRFFVDEAYDLLFVRPIVRASHVLYEQVDRRIIDGGMVEGSAWKVFQAGGWLQRTQLGVVNAAVGTITGGTLVVLAYLWLRVIVDG